MEEACRTALDGVMAKAKEDGGLMSEIMEKVALMGMAEREIGWNTLAIPCRKESVRPTERFGS